ncbi:protein MOR1 isoform X1 [Tanacetum coccineum]
MATLTSISGLESAMGPAIEKSSKGIVSDIVKCIGDNKKHMRECTSWVASTNLDKMVQYITPSMTPMTDAKLGADGRTDLFDWLSKQLAIQLRPKIGMSNQLSKQLVMKNVSDIQGPALAIVLERLKSHGVFPEVHDKTRATRTGPTVKTTSKIGKSNWLSKQLAIHVYLQELGIDEIRRRVGARANDLHMLKTLLYELCKLRGTAITGHLSMVPIDMEPQPIILAYIDLNLQTLAAARMLTPTRPTGQTQCDDSMANNPMPAARSVGAQLKESKRQPLATRPTGKVVLAVAATHSGGCNRDSILSLASVKLNQRLLLSSIRDGRASSAKVISHVTPLEVPGETIPRQLINLLL